MPGAGGYSARVAGANSVTILGHLGRDPDLRYAQGGAPTCKLSVATSRRYTNKNNEAVEETEWHRVAVFGKQAEACANFLTKGRQVCVEGRLRTSSYDKDGQKHYTTEIVAEQVHFIGGRCDGEPERAGAGGGGGGGGGRGYGARGAASSRGAPPARAADPVPEPDFNDYGGSPGDDDIPF